MLLALCNMATLYIRNVPDPVVERLGRLAGRVGLSVSGFALRELSEIAKRADNPALVGDLPDLGVTADEVVQALESGRSER